ncbi:MAG: right-handed parallel beta-helix repeat-containing protein, partial [Clostridia bacterium]|nr:right-handed parallel beta-helix repeat-containing protein [Clostridia bacterium]
MQQIFYVAQEGNDLNAGTFEAPLATIEEARNRIRTLNKNMSEDILVYIREGRYFIDRTLCFDERDSGTNGYKIRYINYPGEEAYIIGGTPICGWESYSGSIFRAYVGQKAEANWLFENGEPCVMARLPKKGYYTVEQKAENFEKKGFKYKPQDLPEKFSYKDARIFIWPGEAEWNWFTETKTINHVNFEERLITLNVDSPCILDKGARYFIQGSIDFLTEPGEFYFDREAGYLYYYPRSLPIFQQEIVAPMMKRIVEIKGTSPEKPVKDICFDGITFCCTDFSSEYTMPAIEIEDNDERDEFRHGAIYLENACFCEIKNCRILNSGFSGIILNRYAQENIVSGNIIRGIGYNGVYLTGWGPGKGNFNSACEAYVNRCNIISNNFIRDCGMLIGHGSGIQLYQSGENKVANNDISRASRYGISLKGLIYKHMLNGPGVYFGKKLNEDNYYDFLYTKKNLITNNHVYNVLYDSQDGGAIEMWGTGKDNTIDGNMVHDIRSGLEKGAAIGIYLDDEVSYTKICNNIICRVGGASWSSPALIKGRHNILENNIFAYNDTQHAVFFQELPDSELESLTIKNNIFLIDKEKYIYKFQMLKGTTIKACDSNIVFSCSGKYCVGIYYDGNAGDEEIPWEDWLKLNDAGYDKNT